MRQLRHLHPRRRLRSLPEVPRHGARFVVLDRGRRRHGGTVGGDAVTDVVVTLPQSFGLVSWVIEGDAAGTPETGEEWDFSTAGSRPDIMPGERVYVTYKGHLIGYAPLVRLDWSGYRGAFIRKSGAVAVTIPETIRGFRGWRYRWWDREAERPYPEWLSIDKVPPDYERV